MSNILICRTDSIGDVILTLPMLGILKQHNPDSRIYFLGRSYTQAVIESCSHVDSFLNLDTILPMPEQEQVAQLKNIHADAVIHVFPDKFITRLAKKAGIPVRIATTNRFFTWGTCNRLVKFSRKHSNLHEVQLNLKLLKPIGIHQQVSLTEISEFYGLKSLTPSPIAWNSSEQGKFKLILHPKSKGSAREWGLTNFSRLIELLPSSEYHIIITGTGLEGQMMQDFLTTWKERVTDLTGKLTLSELMAVISESDGLIAASTGPLHMAAALGKIVVGLYAPMRPIFPTRWAPIGEKASFLVQEKYCNDCKKTLNCHCLQSIRPGDVMDKLTSLRKCF